jgi:LCP family protein required for cell wall assembly
VAVGWYGTGMYMSMAHALVQTNPVELIKGLTATELQQTNGRTSILLAGYSADDAGHSGANLTDSIMMVSIRQSDNSAVMISIPRDLYVNIPGHGYSKINAAYEYGEQDGFSEAGYAAGGMGLLEKMVQEATGIDSNYYALINYAAFKDTVDAVGGVSTTINSTDSRGVYDPNTSINLPNGVANLDGQTALNLARARGSGLGAYGFADGDFTRTQYQQQILIALKQKVGSASVDLNPLKISNLVTAVGANVKTDLQLGEVLSLYSASKNLDTSSIESYTLNDVGGTNLLDYYTTPSKQSALIPADGIGDYAGIQSAVNQLLL